MTEPAEDQTSAEDRTPDGDEIDTFTIWLDFGEQGETAITADLTKFNAAIKRARRPRPS